MEFDKVVKERTSVRSYIDKPVTQEQVNKLLEYANAAPSAGNLQAWQFLVVRSEERRKQIVNTTFSGKDKENPPQAWLMEAPMLIVIFADTQKAYERYGETALESLIYLDCSAAVQNILLGAVNLGIESCYIAGFHEDKLKSALNVAKHLKPIAILPIGYSEAEHVYRKKLPYQQLVKYETMD